MVKPKDIMKEEKNTIYFEGKDYIRVTSNPKGDVYLFRHKNIKTANRRAKGLEDQAFWIASALHDETILLKIPIMQYTLWIKMYICLQNICLLQRHMELWQVKS